MPFVDGRYVDIDQFLADRRAAEQAAAVEEEVLESTPDPEVRKRRSRRTRSILAEALAAEGIEASTAGDESGEDSEDAGEDSAGSDAGVGAGLDDGEAGGDAEGEDGAEPGEVHVEIGGEG